MYTNSSEDYISNKDWFDDVVGGECVILRCVSALEYLELFVGYMNENTIDVYAKKKGIYKNINYYIVNSYDNIEYMRFGNILCSSVNQAINDILKENSDMQALTESLCNYYNYNNYSFNGLIIKPENLNKFISIKELAINYFQGA